MSKVSRNDIYARDEKGAQWFEDFLQSFAESKHYSLQDMLDIMNNKKAGDSVESVVSQYREMVGLDAITSEDDNSKLKVEASAPRFLSARHAKGEEEKEEKEVESDEPQGVILLIKQNPDIDDDIRSLCEHSGGTKNTMAILNFLRERLGNEVVSYNDDALKSYIDEVKKEYATEQEEPPVDVGLVGIDVVENQGSETPEFMEHGKRE